MLCVVIVSQCKEDSEIEEGKDEYLMGKLEQLRSELRMEYHQETAKMERKMEQKMEQMEQKMEQMEQNQKQEVAKLQLDLDLTRAENSDKNNEVCVQIPYTLSRCNFLITV